MEQIDLLMQGFAGALSPMNLLWVVVGCLGPPWASCPGSDPRWRWRCCCP